MNANTNSTTRYTQRKWGAVLLLTSAITGTIMLFVDWFQIPYLADSRIGSVRIATFPVKLIDILLQHFTVPVGVAPPSIPFEITGEIYFFIIGVLFWGICAIIALRTTHSWRWLYGVSVGYIILIGFLLVSQQFWMGLYALSPPNAGVKSTNFQWLLLLFCGGIFRGSYLISKK